MNIDTLVKLLDVISKLLSVLIWPVVFTIVLVKFRPMIGDFFANLGEISLKAAGIEASAKRRAEAAGALAAAAVSRAEPGAKPDEIAHIARSAVEIASDAINSRALRKTERAHVLWVDDHPENNIYERNALETLGIRFTISTSTEDALTKIQSNPFELIISDMGRGPDERAGYTLLDKLRMNGNQTPFIIYAGSASPKHRADAISHGAVGCTNHPGELFQMVTSAIDRAAKNQS